MKTSLRSLLFLVPLLLSLSAFGAEQRTAIPLGNSPSLGAENAPVTIVEFIDFQ